MIHVGLWGVEHAYGDGRMLRVFRPAGPDGPANTPHTAEAARILIERGQSGDVGPDDAEFIVGQASMERMEP